MILNRLLERLSPSPSVPAVPAEAVQLFMGILRIASGMKISEGDFQHMSEFTAQMQT